MKDKPGTELRRGWTTGACATAASKAALVQFFGGAFPTEVTITLPKGETPVFQVAHTDHGDGWAEVGITKDAGDDPDVTHGALIIARVSPSSGGIVFEAGEGVGVVTKPGLPIPPGQAAINPVPRQMMTQVVEDVASEFGRMANITITISIPGGAEIAQKTWNPRLGIKGGLSILGTTGIVRPFSCSAWIASIHRGVDVARADGLAHVAGCTGAMSEKAVQALYGLPDHAMLDMGDFYGGLIKYIAKHPVQRLTIGGGIGKLTKLAQGAVDLHSGRSQVDFEDLAKRFGHMDVKQANTALEALSIIGPDMAQGIADAALAQLNARVGPGTDAGVTCDVVLVDRAGDILARAG
ncbi:MAG: cobalt-precorrin-5B (C(1))-methyltransferase [Marinosulfonomonas sp.]